MAQIAIGDHTMELNLRYGADQVLAVESTESKPNRTGTGMQSQTFRHSWHGIDPILLEMAMEEFGYQRIKT